MPTLTSGSRTLAHRRSAPSLIAQQALLAAHASGVEQTGTVQLRKLRLARCVLRAGGTTSGWCRGVDMPNRGAPDWRSSSESVTSRTSLVPLRVTVIVTGDKSHQRATRRFACSPAARAATAKYAICPAETCTRAAAPRFSSAASFADWSPALRIAVMTGRRSPVSAMTMRRCSTSASRPSPDFGDPNRTQQERSRYLVRQQASATLRPSLGEPGRV
jgi:hypothetical protein